MGSSIVAASTAADLTVVARNGTAATGAAANFVCIFILICICFREKDADEELRFAPF